MLSTSELASVDSGHGPFPRPAPSIPTRPADPDNAPVRLLVVDDELDVRAALDRVLTRWGYTVSLAASGADALTQLAATPGIAAAVSDVCMPAMSGVELAGHIHHRHPDIPVLFLTGTPIPQSLLDSPRIGLLTKPMRAVDL